ncbi:glycosyltransferase [Sphingobacterium sp. E70]|uniref:glycosyltransferase n=1 Tax=Sphingobacterium sp. E70 TaxID=2853439 RepID=UPI00211C3008|nr:glycosyltransferase [Sphingobacterium sp. E70]ULT28274.1 glycosyltransferase [Sphingobacterium sp. E70]
MVIVTGSIVLYRNERNVLLEAIGSFLQSGLVIKLYLIDNSPTDELKDIVIDARIEYIHNPSNPGFGAGHNIALKSAIQQGVTYHLILNPDVYYAESVLEELTDYLEKNTDIGNIMPKVLYPNNEIQRLCKLLPTPYDWIGRRFNPFNKMVERRNDLLNLDLQGMTVLWMYPIYRAVLCICESRH